MFDWQVFLTVAIGDFVLADPSPRRNVTTSMFGLKKKKPHRHAKISLKMVSSTDIAGNEEEEEELFVCWLVA